MELLQESDMAEIEVTEGEESVRIVRYASGPMAPMAAPVAAPMPMPMDPGQKAASAPTADTAAANVGSPDSQITAPMVGTFYLSPAPGAHTICCKSALRSMLATTICIIEAMKMMNQIEADKSGRITGVLVDDGEPVEFGQPLFTIE